MRSFAARLDVVLCMYRCTPVVYGNGFSAPSNGAALSESVAASVESATGTAAWEHGHAGGLAQRQPVHGLNPTDANSSSAPAERSTKTGFIAQDAELAAGSAVQRPPASRSIGKGARLYNRRIVPSNAQSTEANIGQWHGERAARAQKLQDEAA